MKIKEIIEKLKFWNREYDEDYLDDEIDESLDEEMSSKDKHSFLKLNKKIVAAMVAAALVISAVLGTYTFRKMKASAKEAENTVATIQVTKQDIQKTLSATGTIISAQESGQFATVTGSYPVEEVYVKVGDEVKKGDPLYKLDMSTMEETLSYQQQALSIQNQQNAISQENANKALEDAKTQGATQINDSNRNLEQSKQDLDTANRAKSNANNAYTAAQNNEADAKNALDNAGSAVTNAQNKVNEINSRISSLQSQIASAGTTTREIKDADGNVTGTEEVPVDTSSLSSQLTQAQSELASANEALTSAQSDFQSKREAYHTAVSGTETAKQSVQSAADSVANANRAVQAAESSLNSTTNTANSNITSQSQSVKSSELSSKSSTLSSQQEIAKSKDELDKATVYASQDGTVTNVNIVAGQTYSGTDAVVIDNVNSLKATADIDEASIASVAVGQKVQIKTDSTGDEIINGTVSFVSPTATKNSTKTTDGTSTTASVSKSRATYRVDVTLDEGNENLRLGMTAKMTFITANESNALVVPSTDLQTDENGNKYVEVQKADGTTENVTVEVGISDDFYTQITGGSLAEGDTIVEKSTDGSADAVIDEMGADGGIYFE
ncbi:MAG: efflux RND transporter periplasmic adaptor subunit [Pseudobutyrivibrio sp.]|nr:efflux RND transporter periplasmic adaptor subunit [Pseudobutyrivibrio sp.]